MGSVTIGLDIDRLLRRTWLECCGHMSEFYGRDRRKVSMNATLLGAFGAVGERLGYVYDFGSSTELVVSLSGTIEGHRSEKCRSSHGAQ